MSILVAREAPDFCAPAVMPNGTIKDDFKLSDFRGQFVVLFFYPLDFTFVCPSEIIAHDHRVDALQALGAQVIAVSIDSQFTHHAWRETPIDRGGIGPVKFPLVADINHDIVRAFGVEHPNNVALRASFLIDQDGIVQHQVVNNLPLGRDVDEMIRMVEALKFTQEHGEVCPAGWQNGQAGMKPDADGVASYLAEHAESL